MQNKICRTPEAAKYCGLAASTFEKMRLTGLGPKFCRLGSRAIGYRIEDLDSWLETARMSSTSDIGGGHAA
jgi:predicted DNA-binding transcriptional regulator AlpA